ncbi:hypothetical protein GCM10025760_11530 [Microbacterium yannicii]|uniref:DUF5671 domain-containing protein n=1 Tax=Microbacterium yannicii TaxID=671622 RepID=A0ABP9M4K0_9MICO|nr:hypothetical protein [Microbacterium yannicii]MCO5954590.1 hypothetical protein [Microbacterium yannicii]
MVKALLAVVANVSVLTALLVYFGWVRADRMSLALGADEAIFGMTVDDYVRRSIRSVFWIPVVAAGVGLLWVWADHRLRLLRRDEPSSSVLEWTERWLWLVAVMLFVLGVAVGWINDPWAFRLSPLVCATALLLLLYSVHLRSTRSGGLPFTPLADGVLRGAVALLVAVGLFWSAANFAVVEGDELAREYESRISTLPGVEISSARPLDLRAPGVVETCISTDAELRHHYSGLRLMESTNGRYFLVSDEWSPRYGVIFVLPADAEDLRFAFVRDLDGLRTDTAATECPTDTSTIEEADDVP